MKPLIYINFILMALFVTTARLSQAQPAFVFSGEAPLHHAAQPEVMQFSEISVFPNPVTGQQLQVRFGMSAQVFDRYELLTDRGEILEKGTLNREAEQTLFLPHLSRGVFLLRFLGQGIVYKVPIIRHEKH